MTKKHRLIILSVLLAATLLYEGVDIYHTYFSGLISTIGQFGYTPDLAGERLRILRVDAKTTGDRPTPASQAGLQAGDVILEAYNARGQGGQIHSLAEFLNLLKTIGPGEPHRLVILPAGKKDEGPPKTVDLPGKQSQPMDPAMILLLIMAILVPLLAIATAYFIGFQKPADGNAFRACLLFLSFSTLFGNTYLFWPPGLREFGLLYHTFLNGFLIYLFMRFFLLFPSPSVLDQKAPWLKTVLLWLNLALVARELALFAATLYSFHWAAVLGRYLRWPAQIDVAFILTVLAIGVTSLVLQTVRARNRDERRRMLILLGGTLISVLPLLVFAFYAALSGQEPPLWSIFLLILSLGFFPASFVYVVLKHRVMGIRFIIRRGLQYLLVSRGFLVLEGVFLFAALYQLAGPVLGAALTLAGPGEIAVLSAAATLLATSGLRRVNRVITPRIERRFFRESYDAQQILLDLGQTVRQMTAQTGQLLQAVTDQISDALKPDHVAVFLRDCDLDADAAGAGKIVLRDRPGLTATFRLCRHRMRLQGRNDEVYSHLSYESLAIYPDSSLGAKLLEACGKDAEPLAVLPDDPEHWAHHLPLADDDSASRADHEVIERLRLRLLVPLLAKERLQGFIALGEKLSEEPYSQEDQHLLQTVAQQTAIALDHALLIRQVARQEKLQRELEIAREVQGCLFPQTRPPLRTIEYTGICRAARGVGGDYYDFIALGPGTLGIALADVSGKGISAALLMANLQAMLRSLAPQRHLAVEWLAADINRQLCHSTASAKYATFFYGVYRDEDRSFCYVNAGHNPALLLRLSPGPGEVLATASPGTAPAPAGRAEELGASGVPVGLFPETIYDKGVVTIHPGEVLVIYTDGVSEAMNTAGEEFGEERLLEVITAARDLDPEAIKKRVLESVDAFVGNAEPSDDLTLVIVRGV